MSNILEAFFLRERNFYFFVHSQILNPHQFLKPALTYGPVSKKFTLSLDILVFLSYIFLMQL